MLRRTRTILFFTLFLLFFIITPLIIFYSQGYRMDFKKWRVVRTGAFYSKVLPRGTEIFVDGKFRKKTDPFFGSILIENLLPGVHSFEIKKSGYQPWKKNLEIVEKYVTEAKNIILIPKNIVFDLFKKDVKGLFFSPKETKFIFLQESFSGQEKSWDLVLHDLEKGISSHLVGEKELIKEGCSFQNLVWSADSERIILEVETEVETVEKTGNNTASPKNFFLLNVKQNPPLMKEISFSEPVSNVYFNPIDERILFVERVQKETEGQTKNLLRIMEKEIDKEEKIVLENVVNYKIAEKNIFWISPEGFLQKSTLTGGNAQKLSSTPLSLNETKYQIEVMGSNIFLKTEEKLFYLNGVKEELKEINGRINSLIFSPDSKKTCFWNNSEIWIMFLNEEPNQPYREQKSKIFLTRFSKEISDVFWYGSHYLIFNAGDEIKVIEIDDRDGIQMWDLREIPEKDSTSQSKLYFNQKDRKLYIFSNDSIFVSQRLF